MPISEESLRAVDALLAEAVNDHVFPGCCYGVLLPDGSTHVRPVGRLTYDPASPSVQARTVYDLASVTKVMATTAMAMLLHQRGLLNLDAPVATLLPEFVIANPDPRRARVTLRMLLEHSSGIPGYVRLFERASGRTAMLAACLAEPLTADPGDRTEYSDLGFILLREILQRIAGEPLDSFCRREIFNPLDMASAHYCPAASSRAAIPPTEDDLTYRHQTIQGEVNDENAWAMGGVAGHAGLFSDVADTLRFAAAILGEPPLFDPSIVRLFATRAASPAGTSRGLGWDTPSAPSSSGERFSSNSIGHLGFTGTSLWIDLDARIAISLLSNRTWPDRKNQAIRLLRPRFHNAVRDAIDSATHRI